MYKKYVIFIVLLIIIFCNYGILANVPDVPSPFPTSSISSDYGPRNLDSKYDFHSGIDYAMPKGTPIVHKENYQGTVVQIKRDENSHIILIEITGRKNFAYLHIFEDIKEFEPGDHMTVESSDRRYVYDLRYTVNNNLCIVFWTDPTRKFANRAICQYSNEKIVGDSGEYIKTLSGEDLLTTNIVNTGDIIAPVGDSGVPGHPHLHLAFNYFTGSPKWKLDNPLYVVQHDTPDYKVTLKEPESTEGQAITVFGKVPLKINVDSTKGLDLDKVKVYLNKKGEKIIDDAHCINETRVADPKKLEINYGGQPDIYPFPQAITSTRGSTIQTGVDPQGDTPGDDNFYFIDFNSKIKKDFSGDAKISEECRYPDGEYTMTIRVTSVNDEYFDKDVDIVIDNFRPYLSSVRIDTYSCMRGGGIYTGEWEYNDETKTFSFYKPAESIRLTSTPGNVEFNFSLVFSEPLNAKPIIEVNGNPIAEVEEVGYEKKEYRGRFSVANLTEEIRLSIQGEDLAGEKLLELKTDSTIGVEDINRDEEGVMGGIGGADTKHSFKIEWERRTEPIPWMSTEIYQARINNVGPYDIGVKIDEYDFNECKWVEVFNNIPDTLVIGYTGDYICVSGVWIGIDLMENPDGSWGEVYMDSSIGSECKQTNPGDKGWSDAVGRLGEVYTKDPVISAGEIKAKVEGNCIRLDYSFVVVDDPYSIGSYEIYRGERSGFYDMMFQTSDTSYLDCEVEDGKVYYYQVIARDIVGNPSEASVEVKTGINVDLTPPVSSVTIGEPKYVKEDKTYITSTTRITLGAIDQVVNSELVSGVSVIYYSIDVSIPNIIYTEPFVILDEGCHTVYYRSVDNAGNIEEIKNIKVYVDNTPPVTSLLAVSGKILDSYDDFKGSTISKDKVVIDEVGRVTLANKWVVDYECDTLPGSEWMRSSYGAITEEITLEGYLHIKSSGTDYSKVEYQQEWGATPSDRCMMEVRAKLIKGAILLTMSSVESGVVAVIEKNQIIVHTNSYSVNTDDNFHTYKLTASGLLVDGINFYSNGEYAYGAHFIKFGFGVYGAGESYFDYVKANYGPTLDIPYYSRGDITNKLILEGSLSGVGYFKADSIKPLGTDITYEIQYSLNGIDYGTNSPEYNNREWKEVKSGDVVPQGIISAMVRSTLISDTNRVYTPVINKISISYEAPVEIVDNKLNLFIGDKIGLIGEDNIGGVGVSGSEYKLYGLLESEPSQWFKYLAEISLPDPYSSYNLKYRTYDLLGNYEIERFVEVIPINTPAGTNVSVNLGEIEGTGIVVIFNSVTNSGLTKAKVAELPEPLPTFYELLGVCYDITTTASFSQKIEISMKREDLTEMSRLLHFEDMIYFREMGFIMYDFGGYAFNTSDKSLKGINNFKDSFGGELVLESNYESITLWMIRNLLKLFR